MRILVFVFMITAGLTSAAYADATKRDWFWVVNSLQARGINPSNVPWYIINQTCIAAPLDSDELANCQYEKVMEREQYIVDRDLCDAESVGTFPQSLKQPISDRSWYGPSLTRSELRLSRTAYFKRCMADLGWLNADNYLLGKRSSRLEP